MHIPGLSTPPSPTLPIYEKRTHSMADLRHQAEAQPHSQAQTTNPTHDPLDASDELQVGCPLRRLVSLQRFWSHGGRTIALLLLLASSLFVLSPSWPSTRSNDPLWTHAPWKLPRSRFPKVAWAPEKDWPNSPQALGELVGPLIRAPPPLTYACNAKSHGPSSPLLFVGVFSAAENFAAREQMRRYARPDAMYASLARSQGSGQDNNNNNASDLLVPYPVEFKFVLSQPLPPTAKGLRTAWHLLVATLHPNNWLPFLSWPWSDPAMDASLPHPRSHHLRPHRKHGSDSHKGHQASTQLLHALMEEQRIHGDLVILPTRTRATEDASKTHEFLQYLAQRTEEPPRYVLKTDDQTLLVWPNVLDSFSKLDCRENVYWGSSWGSWRGFPFHFRSRTYGLSWPLVKWLGNTRIPAQHVRGPEGAQLGSWLRTLDFLPSERLLHIDWSILMGNWDSPDTRLSADTMALHGIKRAEDWTSQAQVVQDLLTRDEAQG